MPSLVIGYNEFDNPTVHSRVLPGKGYGASYIIPSELVWIWFLKKYIYLFISFYFQSDFWPNYFAKLYIL